VTDALGSGVALALAALVPVLLLAMTSFVKLSIVFSMLRSALGAPDAPSTLVVTALSLVLTILVMAPVALQMRDAADAAPAAPQVPALPSGVGAPAVAPTSALLVPASVSRHAAAIDRGLGPLRAFLTRHSGTRERETMTSLAHELGSPAAVGDELWILAPAFVTTELKEAFAIAVVLFIPFLVLDLVVAMTLTALGLSSTSPQTVALPLKLALFVAVDGWRLLVEGLLKGYV
jgi:type III secretion protein R